MKSIKEVYFSINNAHLCLLLLYEKKKVPDCVVLDWSTGNH